MLSMGVLAAICLAATSLAQTSGFSFWLWLLWSRIFSARVSDSHVAHMDVDDDILADEITDRDVVVR